MTFLQNDSQHLDICWHCTYAQSFLEGVDYSNYDVIMCFRAAAATSQMLTSFRQQGSHVTQGFLKGNPNKRFQLPSRVATERVILSINW